MGMKGTAEAGRDTAATASEIRERLIMWTPDGCSGSDFFSLDANTENSALLLNFAEFIVDAHFPADTPCRISVTTV
tara:strand:+ start:991 stop:1218 length:228 start_codon:yes stop_codon:yes gene_type:complete